MKSYELPNNVLTSVPEPLVSVRTSTYNHGKYIRQCIEGVLMQKTDFPFEYIIGEDCSTDDTMDIVKEYAEKYPDVIRVVTADRNVGMRGNGERCISMCRGKYVAICEGDDYWTDPYKLQRQVDYMEAHPECPICFTSQDAYLQESDNFVRDTCQEIVYYDERDMIRANWVGTLTSLTRASIISEYKDEIQSRIPDFPLGDWTMWLYCSMIGRIVKLPEVTGVYRVLQHSASHTTDTVKQMRFIVETYRMREYFNRLLGINKRWMRFRTYRDAVRFSVRYAKERKESVLPLLRKTLLYVIKNPVSEPSREFRNRVAQLLQKY